MSLFTISYACGFTFLTEFYPVRFASPEREAKTVPTQYLSTACASERFSLRNFFMPSRLVVKRLAEVAYSVQFRSSFASQTMCYYSILEVSQANTTLYKTGYLKPSYR